MNNLNLRAWTNFHYELSEDEPDCSSNCQAKIQKELPFWVNNQPFWTYHCKCCNSYQFKPGKTNNWGGVYD